MYKCIKEEASDLVAACVDYWSNNKVACSLKKT